jgi:small-conductance mechanosensitive channel
VLGLAISFGSQALVKDIVSGIFYLADDAFRVGEYIRCGQAEGTVEGFTLRSIRLRHRDGQIHVIPFGDLGQIANFSRDWAAIKFNLRFARDTDVEKLREATKKIAADLMAEPDLRTEILEPLRVHSVAEVADNALVVRFKLKTLPANSGAIQDRALRRMLKGMPELGFAFAA